MPYYLGGNKSLKELRLPSGLSVTDAKEQAKKISKSEKLALRIAQGWLAAANRLDMDWSSYLNGEGHPVASFTFNDESLIVN